MKKSSLMKFQFIVLMTLFCSFHSTAQQWGLYTLYATKNGTQAFLIDTADTPVVYKTWTFLSTKKSGYSAYLVPGDTLVRSFSNSGNVLSGGGITGGVQKVTWNGTVVWDFVYSSSTYCIHHDICPMPNGNVLMISYDVRTGTEATLAGSSSSSTFYSEKLIEVHPTGPTTGTIVWEWKLWDHMCQNYDATKNNYVTSIVNNPQLLNINYNGSGSLPDRYHMNGVDYNPTLDQIVVSMHFMNSVFIIDHSTTTAQAAGHTGGNSGKGGDFLYRWGNPASYGVTGTTANFVTVHDAHWVPSDNPNYPNYLAGYNNQGGTGGKTAIDIWNPPYNGYNYTLTVGQAYTPAAYAYRFNSLFTATNEGNSQQLPNGNMLVNNAFGAIYEVNATGTQLWTKASANSSHAYRYSKCYVRGPLSSATATATQILSGTSDTLKATAISQTETSPTYTYAWSSLPAGFTSNLQNPVINPTTSATYTVTITNTALSCSSSANVVVNVNGSSILSTSSTANPQTICDGDQVQLNSNPSGGNNYTYQWSSLPSGFASPDQNPTINPSSTTTYYVTVYSGTDSASSSVSVTVNPIPSLPIISQNGNILSSSSTTGNQWYYNSTIISGAISQNHTALNAGNYQVKVTNAYSCTSMSSIYTFNPDNINDVDKQSNILIYPNPVNDMLHIEGITDNNKPIEVCLYNSIGKCIYKASNTNSINMSNFEAGLYFISISFNNETNYNKKVFLFK